MPQPRPELDDHPPLDEQPAPTDTQQPPAPAARRRRGNRTWLRLKPVRDWPYLGKWLLVGVALGAVAGLGAIALYELLHLVTVGALEHLAGYVPGTVAGDGPAQPATEIERPWVIPLLVAGGAFAGALLVRLLAPDAGGHGTDAAIHAIHHSPKDIRGRVTVVKLAASALTLGTGGSGGTEGPAAQISAAFGSVSARAFRLRDDDARIAATAGLAAGIGAIFRAPVGGALLGVELLYRRGMAAEMLVPSMIAAIVAYLEFGAVFGFQPMLAAFEGQPGPSVSPVLFPLFLLLGAVAGVAARCYNWFFHGTAAFFDRLPKIPSLVKPLIGGLAVGLLALLLPDVLGTGYGLIQSTMNLDWATRTPLWIVLALPAAKIVATSLTVGSGGTAGIFGPGMVIGATAGLGFWRLAVLIGLPVDSPVPFVIAGIVACLGSVIHAPISLTVMASEITGTIDYLFPTILALTVAMAIIGDSTLYPSQPRTYQPPSPRPD